MEEITQTMIHNRTVSQEGSWLKQILQENDLDAQEKKMILKSVLNQYRADQDRIYEINKYFEKNNSLPEEVR